MPSDDVARHWSASIRSLSVKVTLVSALLTAAIGLCLYLAGNLLRSGDQRSTTLGPLNISLSSPGVTLVLVFTAIVLWAVLGSLSRLYVARQARDWLRSRRTSEPFTASTDDEAAAGPSVLGERLLLEGHLLMWSLGSRLAVLAGLLLVVTPWLSRLGILVATVVLLGVVRRRLRIGRRVYDDFRKASRKARLGNSQDLIDAIYRRETIVQRLPAHQVLLLTVTTMGFVLLPEWLLERQSLSLASIWILLMLQAVLALATSAANLGWREEAFFGEPLFVPEDRGDQSRALAQPRTKPMLGVVLLPSAPTRWPQADAVLVRSGAASDTVLVVARGDQFGGVGLPTLASDLSARGHALLAVQASRISQAVDALEGLVEVSAIYVEPGTDASQLAQSLPGRRPVVITSDAVARHLYYGMSEPGLVAVLGPAHRVTEAVQVSTANDARHTWVAILGTPHGPDAEALIANQPKDVRLLIVRDMSNNSYRTGIPPISPDTGDALNALIRTYCLLGDTELVLGTGPGCLPAIDLAHRLGKPRVVLFNPPAGVVAPTAEVHAAERARATSEFTGRLITYDTGSSNLVFWLARRGLLKSIFDGESIQTEPGKPIAG